MTYTTISGDMWDSIAYSQLGSVDYTGQLMALNMKHIDYFIFPAGIVLQLPEVDKQKVANPLLPVWKQKGGMDI